MESRYLFLNLRSHSFISSVQFSNGIVFHHLAVSPNFQQPLKVCLSQLPTTTEVCKFISFNTGPGSCIDVIFALAQKSVHIPYRNSKLTQILQTPLGKIIPYYFLISNMYCFAYELGLPSVDNITHSHSQHISGL
ncbi:kinesin motor domain protein [Medicago truncatula]|uniref:Kinesin motor domain protein n=1 Tax=Medicago truncatula TaxID=3880 RepID=G7KN09_MEDTR|nr:kinesin motor domain protein [Medicago truncatula]